MPERRVVVLFLFTILLASSPTNAQTVNELYDPATLHDLHLTINSRDFQALRVDYLQNTYYPADLEWRNVHVRNIAVRSRGTGSRNPVKLGIKIEFGRYVTGQSFLGLESLVLDNLWQD